MVLLGDEQNWDEQRGRNDKKGELSNIQGGLDPSAHYANWLNVFTYPNISPYRIGCIKLL